MADTTFVNGTTLTDADWFNDVNRLHYTILSDPADVAAVKTALAIAAAAAQADQETGSSTTTYVSPGRQQFHPSAAKAWVRHDDSAGTPTVIASYNVTSITDNGVGDFTYNWTVAFSSANYAVSGVGSDTGGTGLAVGHPYAAFAAGSAALRWRDANNTLTDPSAATVIAYGDQ